jgi:hypothetical protein
MKWVYLVKSKEQQAIKRKWSDEAASECFEQHFVPNHNMFENGSVGCSSWYWENHCQ